MAQIRFQVKGLAGSAARDAEQEKRSGMPQTSRIMGGSAARSAEERKRAEDAGNVVPGAGFSLRAQRGEVVRRESAGDVRGTLTSPMQNARHAQNEISAPGDDMRDESSFLDPSKKSTLSASFHPGDQSAAGNTPQAASGASAILRRIMSHLKQSS